LNFKFTYLRWMVLSYRLLKTGFTRESSSEFRTSRPDSGTAVDSRKYCAVWRVKKTNDILIF